MEKSKSLEQVTLGQRIVIACLVLLIFVTIIFKEYDLVKVSLTISLLLGEFYGVYSVLNVQEKEVRRKNYYKALLLLSILVLTFITIVFIK
jgi:hypothetical protein